MGRDWHGRNRGRNKVVALAGAVVGAAVALTPGASAATGTSDDAETATTWTRVTDANASNTDEVGVVRTGDGVLHVFWRARVGPVREEIRHTPITDGRVGTTNTVSGPWGAAGNPAAIVTSDGGLRVFFGGLTGTSNALDGMQSASSDASGTTWTPQGGRVSSTTSAIGDVGAALRQDGVPAFAYTYSFVLGLHFGLDPGVPDTDLLAGNACCAYFPNLAFSKSDGSGYLVWYSNVDGQVGLWAQPVWPTTGEATAVPQSAVDGKAVNPSQRTPITARPDAGGTYVAYCSGYPSCTEVLLWKIGETTPLSVATGSDIEDVNIAADPDGRLWVMWEDTADTALHAARTNADATEMGATVSFGRAEGATTLWRMQGNAISDQLDVFASFTTPNALATWHAAVLPGLTVATKKAKGRVAFTVSDAGDPVKGAKIAFKKKTLTTNAKGQVSGPAGKGTATVTKSGYTEATATVR